MNLDYLIYGRGLSQTEGFTLQAAPGYVRSEFLLYLSELQGLGDERNASDIAPDILAQNPNPWADTYLFVCQPPPGCCALVRCTRAEGDTPGTWLKEVRQKDVWSLEGFCAPFEQRDRFFALVPSMLLYLSRNRTSFYHRNRMQEITLPLSIPDEGCCNPYADAPVPADLTAPLHEQGTLAAWESLCTHIKFAPQPFPFLFGPLAAYYQKHIGSRYGIRHVFAPDTFPAASAEQDPFLQIEPAAMQDTCTEQHTYQLCLHVKPSGRREMQRQWGITEPARSAEDLLLSAPAAFDPEQGIQMADLLAEAEGVRQFAARMQWTVSAGSAPPRLRYQFVKEGS